MLCKNCGKSVDTDSEFCNFCGKSINDSDTRERSNKPVYVISDKNEGLALIFSLLIIGLGQIYVGKIARGLVFFVVGVGMTVVCYAALFLFLDESFVGVGLAVIGAISIAALVLWIYNIVDAYNLAKEYNEYIRKNNEKPW